MDLQEKLQYKEAFPVVICDPSAQVNLAFRMTSVGFCEVLLNQHFDELISYSSEGGIYRSGSLLGFLIFLDHIASA